MFKCLTLHCHTSQRYPSQFQLFLTLCERADKRRTEGADLTKKLTSPRQKETHLYRDNLNFCLPKFYSGSAATNPAHNEAQEVHHKQKGHHQKLQ